MSCLVCGTATNGERLCRECEIDRLNAENEKLRYQLAGHEAFRQRMVDVLASAHWVWEGSQGERGEMSAYALREAAKVARLWPEVKARLAELREERDG